MGDPETVDFDDYYDLLDVSRSASRSEIYRAYEEKVLQHHPDRKDGNDRPESMQMFRHLKRAKEVLCTPNKREKYDETDHETFVLQEFSSDPVPTSSNPESQPQQAEEVTDGASSPLSVGDPTADGQEQPSSPSPGSEHENSPFNDLLSRDPLEKAWQGWRRQWTLRILSTIFGLGSLLLLILNLDDAHLLAFIGPIGITAGVFMITGAYAHISIPVREQPGTPPEGASIGLLRPERAHTLVRRGLFFSLLSLILVITGAVSDPHPWIALHSLFSGSAAIDVWPLGSIIGADLQSPVSGVLFIFLCVSMALGVVYGLIGLSAGAWSSFFSGRSRTVPLIWECLGVTTVVILGYGIATGSEVAPGGVALPKIAGLLATTDGLVTGLSLAVVAHVAFVLLQTIYLTISVSS